MSDIHTVIWNKKGYLALPCESSLGPVKYTKIVFSIHWKGLKQSTEKAFFQKIYSYIKYKIGSKSNHPKIMIPLNNSQFINSES